MGNNLMLREFTATSAAESFSRVMGILPTSISSPFDFNDIKSIVRGSGEMNAPQIAWASMPRSREPATMSGISFRASSRHGANTGNVLNAFFQKSERLSHAIGNSCLGREVQESAMSVCKSPTKCPSKRPHATSTIPNAQ